MKLSIITAVKNARDDLIVTFESLESQLGCEVEWIVVDGGSTDGTVELISEHERTFSRFISEPDEGISDAWNKGVALSRGEYLAFLNAGDAYAPNFVAEVLKKIATQPAALYLAKVNCKTGDRLVRTVAGRVNSGFRLTLALGFLHPGAVMARDIFDETGGFDPKLKYAMDCDLFFRAMIHWDLTFVPLATFVDMQTGNHKRS